MTWSCVSLDESLFLRTSVLLAFKKGEKIISDTSHSNFEDQIRCAMRHFWQTPEHYLGVHCFLWSFQVCGSRCGSWRWSSAVTLSTGPTAILLGVGPEKQLDDLFPQSHMQRLGRGSLQGWFRINRCGWGISCHIQLGTHAAQRERWWLVTLPVLFKKDSFPCFKSVHAH